RLLRVGIEHDDGDALRREAPGRGAAESTGAAGDDRRAPGELHQRAPSINVTIVDGTSGRRVISTPNGDSASAIALTTAGGAPIAPPSPSPCTHPGPGAGVSTCQYSIVGTSAA